MSEKLLINSKNSILELRKKERGYIYIHTRLCVCVLVGEKGATHRD